MRRENMIHSSVKNTWILQVLMLNMNNLYILWKINIIENENVYLFGKKRIKFLYLSQIYYKKKYLSLINYLKYLFEYFMLYNTYIKKY